MFKSPEPLTTFFSELLPAAKRVGYKLVITLLAREADSVDIFRDVERYWSSLHDVTGEHVLFVLGANNAGSKFPHTGMREKHNPVMHFSPHASMSGNRTLYWKGTSHQQTRGLRLGHEKPSPMLARSHSLEITSLRSFFGLREDSIPAVLVILLGSDHSNKSPVMIPMTALSGTIYSFLKKLVDLLEPELEEVQKRRSALAKLHENLDELKKRLRNTAWIDPRLLSESASQMVKQSANEILTICDSPSTEPRNKRRCFDLLRVIAAQTGNHSDLTIRFQRFIDHSFFDISPEYELREDRKKAVLASIKEIETQEQLLWQQIGEHLAGLSSPRSEERASSWDFFLAYSSKDSWYADRLLIELSKHGQVFLDRMCLRPGDVWPQRLRAEQDRARCTVTLITENTDSAWSRAGAHRIVPILVGSDAKLPYGLEQVHAVRHAGHGDFSSVARQIAEVVHDKMLQRER